jgi:molybdate transport system substrate-binding protein
MPSNATVKLIASNAVKEACAELVRSFEQSTGHRVEATWGGTLDISARIESGEVVDVVILAAERIDDLIARGRLAAGSRVDIARSGIAVAVRAGARKPDISFAAALASTLQAARSIVLSSGPSSVYLADLFRKMGIAEVLKSKIHQIGPGLPVAAAVARGEGEIGFTQTSELLHAQGVDYVGPLPPDIQHVTVWSAGLHAGAPVPDTARALLAFLAGPQAAAAIRRSGMEPG